MAELIQNTVPEQARIFDRRLLRERRTRAAANLHAHDFLLTEIAERLADRLSDIARAFPLALDLGARDGILARTLKGRGAIETLIQSDATLISARRARQGHLQPHPNNCVVLCALSITCWHGCTETRTRVMQTESAPLD